MKKNLLYVFSVGLIVALSSIFAVAQNTRRTVPVVSNKYVVSAKAGAVNFVEGAVSVERKTFKGELLLKGDQLEIGDKVVTGANGKAEILLNPGSFVRLAGNSEFEFKTVSLDDLQLKVNRGSAMFEVITDSEFSFVVNTPKGEFSIVKSGIYRVDVQGDGTGKIEVWKGKAEVGATEVKGGKQATVGGQQVAVAKFDRGDKDALESWSKTRSKEIAKLNAQLLNASVRNSLINSFYHNGWNLYGSYGLWIYSALYGSYCFLPFGYGWSSPYGYYYQRNIWQYYLPPVIYTNPPTTGNNPTPRLADSGSPNTRIRQQPSSRENGEDRITPPFQKIQRGFGGVQFPDSRQNDTMSPQIMSTPRSFPSDSQPIQQQQPTPTLNSSGTPPRRGDN